MVEWHDQAGAEYAAEIEERTVEKIVNITDDSLGLDVMWEHKHPDPHFAQCPRNILTS